MGAVAKIVLEKAINPIIDLSGFPVSTEIAAVTVTDDAVFVVATGSRAPVSGL